MSVATPQDAFISAVRKVLRPLVRAVIANGLTFTYMSRLLKGLYIEVAEESFGVAGRKLTDSRISLLTGVHRKDVKLLRGQVGERFQPPQSVNIGSRVVDRWINDSRFTSADGRSRPIHRSEPDESGVCFETLVDTVSKDVHPRTVLDELQRLGVVGIDSDNMVHLKTEAFVPREGIEELLYYFGVNLHDHIAAASHNLMGHNPAFLELAVDYDKLDETAVTALRDAAREHGREALLTVNKLALDLSDPTAGGREYSQRIRFGVYFYAEPDAPDANGSGPPKANQR